MLKGEAESNIVMKKASGSNNLLFLHPEKHGEVAQAVRASDS